MTDINGCPISAANRFLLCANVIVNIYNAVLIWVSNSTTQMFLYHALKVVQFIILVETVLCILAICLSTLKNTFSSISCIRFSVYIIFFTILCAELTVACMFAVDLFANNRLAVLWNMQIQLNNKRLIAALILATYFVFKGYVVGAILPAEKELRRDLLRGNEYHLPPENFESVELNMPRETSVSLAPPPSYDQCILDSNRTPLHSPPPPPPPPPPYSDV